MFEGKNIHYSLLDKKPLCSFSSKICNQHRLNGYAFCVRHILEDPTAPFRRCSYVAKSSKQKCTQAIPMHEEREYCNNHMQVLGMLPRKERKKKEKEKEKAPVINDVTVENKVIFESQVKPRFESRRLHMSKQHKKDVLQNKDASNLEDPDDPYAFPDHGGDSNVNSSTPPFLSFGSSQDTSMSVTTPNSVGAKSPGSSDSGVSSIAKLYPELAEKLEKIKPKFDSKSKDKNKDKSNRTMNILQSKIAQNKIKDKLKKNQESSSQSQSPCHSMPSIGDSSETRNAHTEGDGVLHPMDSPSGLLHNTIGGNFRNLSDLKRPSHVPPYLPVLSQDMVTGTPPENIYPGGMHPHLTHNTISGGKPPPPSLPEGIPHGVLPENLPGMPRADHLPQQLPHHNPVLISSPSQADKVVSPHRGKGPASLPPTKQYSNQDTTPRHHFHRPSHLPVPNPVAKPVPQPSPPVRLPPPYKDSERLNNCVLQSDTKPSVSVAFSSSSPHQGNGLPPPPPSYRATKSSHSKKKHKIPVISQIFLPTSLTKVSKLKNVLPEENAIKRFHSKTALRYYMDFVKRKIHNHCYVGEGLCSSDEDSSEEEMVDLLPWQPEWFTASSDEEVCDDEDEQDDTLRTAKLALIRARMRRRCFQSRKSHRANCREQLQMNNSTKALIEAARDQPENATTAVQEIKRAVPTDQFDSETGRRCCHKNDEEKRCKNSVLPYTNHCLRHIMYNVDQQLFDYCTAKFPDNTQCCVPVFDLKHELPLCVEHGIKADSYFSADEFKPKRPRKKTKPSALTRPPKKGKKKKNQRKCLRPQKPSPPSLPTGNTEMPPSVACPVVEEIMETSSEVDTNVSNSALTPKVEEPVVMDTEPASESPVASPAAETKTSTASNKPSLSDLPEAALGQLDMDKALELPLEQASRLLEEQDFHDVFNKLPDDTFDLFSGNILGKNGDVMPSNEDIEELERHIVEANIDLTFAQQALDKFSNGGMELDDEQLKMLAASLLNTDSSNMQGTGEMCNGLSSEQRSIEEISRKLQSSAAELTSQTPDVLPATSSMYPAFAGNALPDNHVLQQSGRPLTLNMPVTSAVSTSSQLPFSPHTNLDIPTTGIVGAHSNSLPQQFLAAQNPLPTNFITNQQQQQQPIGNQSQSQIFVQQQPHTSIPVGLQNVQQIVAMSRTQTNHIDSMRSVLVTPDKVHQLQHQQQQQQQNSVPQHITSWPTNLNVLNFQNGFPANFQPHSNDLTTNVKFGVNIAQHVIPNDRKQELSPQYHEALAHSNSTETPALSQQTGFETVQFKRLPRKFSAPTGSSS